MRKRGAVLEIRHVPPQIARLFELVGVNNLLGVGDGQVAPVDRAVPPDGVQAV